MKYKYRTGLRLKRKKGKLICLRCRNNLQEDRNNPLQSKRFCGKCTIRPYTITFSKVDNEMFFVKEGKNYDSFLFKFRPYIWLLRNRKLEGRFSYGKYKFSAEPLRRLFRNHMEEGVFYVEVDEYGMPVLNRGALIVYEILYRK